MKAFVKSNLLQIQQPAIGELLRESPLPLISDFKQQQLPQAALNRI